MPVSVDIPVRLRVDPAALRERQDLLVEAVGAAVGRALEASHRAVIEPRGGYVGVHLHPPTTVWGGAGLAAVPAALRSEIEALLAATLAARVASSGVLDLALAAEDLGWPLAADPAEAIDEGRYAGLVGLYALPSYEGGGRPTPIHVVSFDEPIDVMNVDVVTDWLTVHDDGEVFEAFGAEAGERGYAIPDQGYTGMIFRVPDGRIVAWVHEQPSQRLVLNRSLGAFTGLVVQGSGKDERFALESIPLRPGSAYRLSWYAHGRTEQERQAAVRAYWSQALATTLRASARRLNLTSDAEVEAAIERRVRDRLDGFLATLRLPGEPGAYCTVEIDGVPYLSFVPGDVPENLRVELLPLTTVVTRPRRERQGTGTGSGAGRPGDAGTPGDGAAGGAGGGRPEVRRAAGPDGIVYAGEEAGSTVGRRFPISRYARYGAQDCSPFWGEPPLEELGEDGVRLRRLIEGIAADLEIGPCEHAGQFCVVAARAIGSRAAAVAGAAVDAEGLTTQAAPGSANLGLLQFTPAASPAIQLARYLATMTPRVERLADETIAVMRKPEHAGKIGHGYASWLLHLTIDLGDAMDEAVSWLFTQTCRLLMLQLLRASKKAIEQRQATVIDYAPIFERLVVAQLVGLEELKELRRELRDALPRQSSLAAVAEPVADAWRAVHYTTWHDAYRGVIDLFAGREEIALPGGSGPRQLVYRDGQVVGIRDSAGFPWSAADLDEAIATREATAAAIDPLAKHVASTPGMLDRFRRNRRAIREELERLLAEMKGHNERVTAEIRSDPMAAFRIARVGDKLPAFMTPAADFPLQGIHLLAHEEIGEFFRGATAYDRGMRALFASEMGRQAILTTIEVGGTVFLAVVCAPAAMVVGAGLAAYHLNEAYEREETLGALLDPDQVASRAEVEAELFASQLGAILSVIPGVGTVGRPAARGTRALVREGARAGWRVFATGVRRRALVQMAEGLKHGLLLGALREYATGEAINLALQKLLTDPVYDALEREFQPLAAPSAVPPRADR